ncbi:vesicle transport v-SNARE protein [Ostertagia ostertagi]
MVTSTIARLPSLPVSERPASVQAVQRVLTDVAELLEQMELAVRDLAAGSAERTKYELRVKSYRNDKRLLDSELEKAIKRLREAADRDELLAYDEAVEMDQQEEQLIANTERLERSSRKIQNAYRMAVETEQIGTEVLGNLSQQRETISRARERMREADVELGRSNRLLNTMIRRYNFLAYYTACCWMPKCRALTVKSTVDEWQMYNYRKPPPELPQTEFVVIQYPGVIKNLDRALETLGGLPKISQNHFASQALELRHTPENPYTSASVSEKKLDSAVNVLYTFDTMCDFQYLPLKRRQEGEGFDDLIPRLIPRDLPSALCWWDRPDSYPGYTPLFLPPYQFSRYNTPSTKMLCRESDFTLEKIRKKTGHGQNLRLERKALSVTVQANDPFPTAPSEEAVLDADFRCKNEEPHRMLAALFRERPMWTRNAIAYKTGLDDNLLKTLLQKYAFYIQSGPWGRLWCRFGYDPRTDPESMLYQTLMVSFRQHTRIPEKQIGDSGPLDRSGSDVFQECGQMWYSLCDIKLPFAEALLKQDHSKSSEPEAYGWIHADLLEELRELIKEDVRKTSEDMDADEDLEPTDDF